MIINPYRFVSAPAFTDIYSSSLNTGLQACWKMDGNGIDVTGNGNDGVLTGVTFTTSGKINDAYGYDGANDKIPTSYTAPSGANPFTISVWAYPDTLGGSGRGICTTTGGSARDGFFIVQNSGGGITFNTYQGNAAKGIINSGNTFSVGSWYHIIATYDGSETNLYVDNVNEGTDSTATFASNDFDLVFGEFYASYGSRFWDGKIDEAQIWNRVLTSDERTALYNSASGLKYRDDVDLITNHATLDDVDHYYKLDGDATDATGGSDGTVNGATPSAGYIDTGYDFDANNDTIDTNFSVDSSYQSSFSTSHWAKLDTLDNTARSAIVSDEYPSSRSFILYYDNAGFGTVNSVFAIVNDGSSYTAVSAGDNAISTGNWYHIVTTWDNATDTLKLYVNGVDVTFIENASAVGNIGANEFKLGFNTGQQGHFGGILDEVGFWDRVLTPSEASDLYNNGAGLPYD